MGRKQAGQRPSVFKVTSMPNAEFCFQLFQARLATGTAGSAFTYGVVFLRYDTDSVGDTLKMPLRLDCMAVLGHVLCVAVGSKPGYGSSLIDK